MTRRSRGSWVLILEPASITPYPEDVLVRIRLMQKYGGYGLIPSGVSQQELKTTLPDRSVNAAETSLS